MAKLTQREFEYLMNSALDTKDESMFNDLIKRQNEETFLTDLPVEDALKSKELPFQTKEKQLFIKNVETIINAYKNSPLERNNLENLITDVERAVELADQRLMNQAIRELAQQEPKEIKYEIAEQKTFHSFPLGNDIMAVTEQDAMDAFTLYGFPNETLDMFVMRYFFPRDKDAKHGDGAIE